MYSLFLKFQTREPSGSFLESPNNFSGPESCFIFVCVSIQNQCFNNFENYGMKLPVYKTKLTGLWVRICATIYPTGFSFKIFFRARKVKLPGLSRNVLQVSN